MSFVYSSRGGNIRFAAIRVRGEPHPVTETGNSPCLIVVLPQVTSDPSLYRTSASILSMNNETFDKNEQHDTFEQPQSFCLVD